MGMRGEKASEMKDLCKWSVCSTSALSFYPIFWHFFLSADNKISYGIGKLMYSFK